MNLSAESSSKTVKRSRTVLVLAVAILVALGIGIPILIAGSARQTQTIVSGRLTVEADSYNYYPFTVPNGTTAAIVSGNHVVLGNRLDTIILFVMTDEQFSRWRNNLPTEVYYNSAEQLSLNFSAPIPSGHNYYLVFDNTFSTVSKNISANIVLQYVK